MIEFVLAHSGGWADAGPPGSEYWGSGWRVAGIRGAGKPLPWGDEAEATASVLQVAEALGVNDLTSRAVAQKLLLLGVLWGERVAVRCAKAAAQLLTKNKSNGPAGRLGERLAATLNGLPEDELLFAIRETAADMADHVEREGGEVVESEREAWKQTAWR